MRDGLRTLTELVDRIEGDGVVVDDVSLSRVEDGELTADVSVTFPEELSATTLASADVADDSRLYRGADVGTSVGSANGSESAADSANESESTNGQDDEAAADVPPGFGAVSVRVGGSIAGSIAEGLAAVQDREEGRSAPADANRDEERAPDVCEAESEAESGGSSNDEPFTCRVDGCEETFATEHGMKIHATKAHQSADGSAPSPHRNPERLREVYEACETFEEMTEALDVDVTPQTVRRSMMRLGVHEPTADDGTSVPAGVGVVADATAAETRPEAVAAPNDDAPDESTSDVPSPDAEPSPDDVPTTGEGPSAGEEPRIDADEEDSSAVDASEAADDESAASPTDDAGGESTERTDQPEQGDPADAAPTVDVDELLPAAVDGDAFVAAVREATTLYEVQRGLDMEREEVQTLLAEFGLLDLVHGRVATKHEREDRKAEIERRIVERAGDDEGDDRSEEGRDDRSEEGRDDSASDGPGEPASAD